MHDYTGLLWPSTVEETWVRSLFGVWNRLDHPSKPKLRHTAPNLTVPQPPGHTGWLSTFKNETAVVSKCLPDICQGIASDKAPSLVISSPNYPITPWMSRASEEAYSRKKKNLLRPGITNHLSTFAEAKVMRIIQMQS